VATILEERVDVVEARVDRLEVIFGQFMVQTGMAIQRMDRTIERLDHTVQLNAWIARIEHHEMKAEAARLNAKNSHRLAIGLRCKSGS
jgi:hypothetical protein